MKSAPFDYVQPSSLSDALAELATLEDSKVISGGQSLVPVLAMRLARPTTLVDINKAAGLDELSTSSGHLLVSATVRQRRVELDAASAAVPLLRRALPWVGHREIRSRGTVCGSLAHADPAAELPAVACCLDAELELASARDSRTVRARDFFTGPMQTTLAPGEVLVRARFPQAVAGDGFGFGEIARRHGDFALAGVAAHVRVEQRRVTAVVTGFGVSDRPTTWTVEGPLLDVLQEHSFRAGPEMLAKSLAVHTRDVADELVISGGDAHASTGYRRRLFASLLSRELANATHAAAKEDR